ncbi:uncharacterized protein KY384_004138 [Bacidia gigantensis]|uniref:uncharacterized protein n=1 Tax=Bacidia gigantensis TaxID=2732470 RepID=UPI001D04961D|nr:uncharacterized protein KY384_004138 [Bacidia gigantensis]KAG8530781.1 hypothetical protein KY384_004138 [Bacidia gigantensis]
MVPGWPAVNDNWPLSLKGLSVEAEEAIAAKPARSVRIENCILFVKLGILYANECKGMRRDGKQRSCVEKGLHGLENGAESRPEVIAISALLLTLLVQAPTAPTGRLVRRLTKRANRTANTNPKSSLKSPYGPSRLA